jgi:hypothetical protein
MVLMASMDFFYDINYETSQVYKTCEVFLFNIIIVSKGGVASCFLNEGCSFLVFWSTDNIHECMDLCTVW